MLNPTHVQKDSHNWVNKLPEYYPGTLYRERIGINNPCVKINKKKNQYPSVLENMIVYQQPILGITECDS